MGTFKYKAVGLMLFPIAGLILAGPGCASQESADTDPPVSLAAATSSPTASTDPVAAPQPPLQTERQRELAEESQGRFGFVKVAWAQFKMNISDTYDKAFGTKPSDYAAMLQAQAADARRQGINGLVQYDFGEQPTYTRVYTALGKGDKDYLVRATAIRALNRSRDHSSAALALYVKSLDDPNIPVQLEACKALAHMPTNDAIDPLLRILNRLDEDKDVRIAAADALRHYRTIEVARSLVLVLSDRDFGIAWSAHRSLITMTGRDLNYDEAAWLAYLTGPAKPFG